MRRKRRNVAVCLPLLSMGTSSSGGATRPQNGRQEEACSGCEETERRAEPCACHRGFFLMEGKEEKPLAEA